KAIKYFTCIVLLTLTSRIYSQIPDTIWTKTFGGTLADVGNSVKQTNDGGFIVAGTTSSFGAGGQDIYLIKTDENGETLWTKTFGGSGNDRASNVVETNDNGYAIFGTTNSYGNGGDDFLLWKTDSLGNTEWYKSYGTNSNEVGNEGIQTSDNGYIMVGNINEAFQKSRIIKTDSSGNETWSKVIINYLCPTLVYSVTQTIDSGYVVCGSWYYWIPGDYVYESYLYKFSSSGDSLFLKSYDFTIREISKVVRNSYDGKLIMGGITGTYDQKSRLLKVTPYGDILWTKEIDGSQDPDYLNSLEQDFDNGFVFTIVCNGNPPYGADFGLIKCDINGDFLWEKRIGGSQYDFARSVNLTNDSGYVVVGETKSFGAGDNDVWLMKLNYPPSAKIQLSKDSLNLTFDGLSFTSKDSLVIYNTGNIILNIDTIYSTNASGFILDIILKDTTIHSAVTWRNSYYNPFEIEPGDSAKLVFTYPLWIPKSFNINETWLDTVIILNNSVNSSSLAIPTVIDFPVGISDESNDLPEKFSLSQNYPNPFNPSTKIKFQIPSFTLRQAQSDIWVTLKVYDVLGNEIATLVNEEKHPGTYEIGFNTSAIKHLPSSGIYFYQLKAGDYVETKKMVLIK
ncbi:MAG: T9SS type A sorting domain-containing protein, partial [Ignavibacteriaceae bacterium]|nr:T9SS type A sorting domain-containing protein [Ignavibacteriaceae bacterium]